MNRNLIIVGLLAILSSCAAFMVHESWKNPDSRDKVMIASVKEKAAFEFDCPTKKLKIKKMSDGMVGVRGCGKRATYLPVCGGNMSKPLTINSCTGNRQSKILKSSKKSSKKSGKKKRRRKKRRKS